MRQALALSSRPPTLSFPPLEARWLCPLCRALLPLMMCPLLQALCSLLRRDASINFKAKGNSLVSVLACNLLMAAYEEDENWPEIFVKVGLPLLRGSPGASALPGVMGAERWTLGRKKKPA